MNSINAWCRFELVLQITEHSVCTFVVPQAVKQATKARFAVHKRMSKLLLLQPHEKRC